jgi:hypothetical protein
MNYCGFCDRTTTEVVPTETCKDIQVCDVLGESVCTEYAQWTEVNCRRFCGFCVGMSNLYCMYNVIQNNGAFPWRPRVQTLQESRGWYGR